MTSSPDDLVLLHNPACSKSRRAKEILVERGVPFRERRYLEAPLSRAELEALRDQLARPVRDWIRSGDAAFAEAGLDANSDETALLRAIASRPALLERPIVIRGERAVIGRPPEEIERLL